MASESGDTELRSFESDFQYGSDELTQSTEFNLRKASDAISDSSDADADNADTIKHGDEIFRQRSGVERQSSAELRRSIDIKHSECKKPCKIMDMIFIGDKYLALADHTNMCVIIVNTGNNKIGDCIPLKANPACLAKLPNDRLAVALPSRQVIRLINLQDHKNYEEIKASGRCTAMDFCKGSLLISISQAGSCSIVLIDLKGTVLREVIKKTDAVNKIIVNPEQSIMYASQVFQNKVLFVTIRSGQVTVYQDQNLKGPKGLAITENGDLLVCGKESSNVYQLTPDASVRQVEHLDHSLGKPDVIAFHPTTKMLYTVSEGTGRVSCLHVPEIIDDVLSPKTGRKWLCQIL